jgi:HEAT repeat protein
MTRRLVSAAVVALIGTGAGIGLATLLAQTGAPAQTVPMTAAALGQAIDQLGDFDLAKRTTASKAVRRAPAGMAVPALSAAARSHKDAYVRYRAIVLLTGFGDDAAGPVMRDLVLDRDNRVRMVVFEWFADHPDPTVLPKLLGALDTERSEFVRPALTRAVAADGDDPRARAAIVPLINRGEDLFRGSVIEALGDAHARYAAAELGEVAGLDGPLQDEAVLALGKLGDTSVLAKLSGLQQHGSDEVQPAIAAAVCMLTNTCAVQDEYLKKTLAFAGARDNTAALLSRVAHALGALAAANHAPALTTLLDAGVPAKDPERSVVAVSLGTVAMRNPTAVLTAFESRADLPGVLALLRDAFDMLSEEDYGQERFCTAIRLAQAGAPAGSKRRQVATAILNELEF